MRDPLTGLGNRRFLEEQVQDLFDSCAQAEMDLMCMVIDLDHFKQVNDTLGHQAGDDILIHISDVIKSVIRPEDYAVRHGGDEFLIFVPGVNIIRVKEAADLISKRFKQYVKSKLPQSLHMAGVSIGIASRFQHRATSYQNLVEFADEQLYQAKQKGRGLISC